MTKLLHAHFLRDLDENEIASLRNHLEEVPVNLTAGANIPVSTSIDLLIAGRVTEDQIRTCNKTLKHLIIPWAGLPEQTRDIMLNYPNITVHNLHHNAVPTAEMAVTLLLAAAKVVIPLDQRLRRGDWSPRYEGKNNTILLAGKNALILGYGSIGKHIAKILTGLQMTVHAIAKSTTQSQTKNNIQIHPVKNLHTLLPSTNALLISVPLTEQTKGVIGEQELNLLPPGALLSNVSRGTVVDEQALFNALRSRQLHAAGLDVWYQYPKDEPSRLSTFPSQYPFHELDNIVLSPHRGGAVGQTEAENLRWKALAENITAAALNHTIPNRVDLKRGY